MARHLQSELDRERIAAVFFDLGHTLMWPLYGLLADVLEQAFNKPVTAANVVSAEQAFRRQVKHFVTETYSDTTPIPGNSYDYYAFLVERCTGQTVAALGEEFHRFAKYAHGYHLRKNWFMSLGPDAIPALEMLKPRFRLGVISNAHGTLERDLNILGIRRYFEVVADSEVVGYAKPDRRIFDYALKRMSIKPEWAVHVGDLPTADIQGATEAGLFAMHYDAQGVFRDKPIPNVPCFRNLVDLAEALIG